MWFPPINLYSLPKQLRDYEKPMDILTLDFETFYSRTFSLSKLTYDEYINDDQFEVIGVGVQKNNDEPEWFSGTKQETHDWLAQFGLDSNAVIMHNAMFDASILAFHFGIYPKVILDTLCMARAVHGATVGGSLKRLAEYYGVGEKGIEVHNFIDYRRETFTPAELAAYGEYCKQDVRLTKQIFDLMRPRFNKTELKLIDMTIRMYTEPKFMYDREFLSNHLKEVKDKQRKILEDLNLTASDLRSNPKFAELLRSYGVEPPMKVSPTTGKDTYALAKTDEGMKALLEHENPDVQALAAARLGVKSSLEETRTQRLIDTGDRNCGYLPIGLNYYGARTGRFSASQGLQFQNLPNKSDLKQGVVAPPGYVIIGADLSNIELRVGLWFAGQMDKLQLLQEGKDLYKDFASSVFNVPYDDVDKDQRFIGKTCIAEGTLVLSDSGWKPIEQVSMSDKLWDGEEFVCHQGLIQNGLKETLPLCGIWLTPDHQVWSGTQWLESQLVVSDSSILSQALAFGAENLPLLDTYKASEEVLRHLLLNVIVAHQNTQWTNTTSKILRALGVSSAPEKPEQPNDIGLTQMLYLMMLTDEDFSIDLRRLLVDAKTQKMPTIRTMGEEELQYMKHGLGTSLYFLDTFKRLVAGIFQNTIWTESTTIKGMNPEILDLCLSKKMPEINGNYQSLRRKLPVYDIASVGMKNRFTILTGAGPLIVHNCSLSLIYGTGSTKLRNAIKSSSGKDIGEIEAKRIVDTYRSEYENVAGMWRTGGEVISAIANDYGMDFGYNDLCAVKGGTGIKLPSGLYLAYPNLRQQYNDKQKLEWVYDKSTKEIDRVYGAKVFQGTVQALARCVIGESMVRINEKYPLALTVHDAVYLTVPERYADEALQFVEEEMVRAPSWLPGIVLGVEGHIGRNLKEV